MLSVIDLNEVKEVPLVVHTLDRLGFHRYWMTEHRSPSQSASPTVLTAVAGSHSSSIRVGTAGIKLRYASPRKVAEDFRVLELLYPGRIDLGLISGRESNPAVHVQLLDGRPEESNDYRAKLRELVALVRGEQQLGDGWNKRLPNPGNGVPQLWGCGLTMRAAEDAAELSIGYVFNVYFANASGRTDGEQIFDRYREAFRPSRWLAAPTAVVVCYGCCEVTRKDAEATFNLEFKRNPAYPLIVGGVSRPGEVPQPTFLGTPEECREQLELLAQRYQVSELTLLCLGPSVGARMRQYELLAEAFELRANSAF
jgi:luciferase family oxidoreductase group 1